METGKNEATNNFVVRLWSQTHYKGEKDWRVFDGTIQDVKTKKQAHFHSVGAFLTKLEDMNLEAEKIRKKQSD